VSYSSKFINNNNNNKMMMMMMKKKKKMMFLFTVPPLSFNPLTPLLSLHIPIRLFVYTKIYLILLSFKTISLNTIFYLCVTIYHIHVFLVTCVITFCKYTDHVLISFTQREISFSVTFLCPCTVSRP